MMPDIFSSFDPYSFGSVLPSFKMILFMNLMIMYIFPSNMVMRRPQKNWMLLTTGSLMMMQLSRTYMVHLHGIIPLMSTLFSTIIIMNLLGLIPYFFSITSHLIFTLSFGLPLWLSMILSSFFKNPMASIAHFLPDGAPDWLNPFLVLIETTSIFVRPMTLSFRLAANMSAGHIVLSLIGIYCASAWFSNFFALMLLLSLIMGYILFEVAICLIQAYIFCLLLSLYSDDHAH